MRRLILFTLLSVLAISPVLAREILVTGTVQSSADKEPLTGAVVSVVGKPAQGTTTNIDGEFSLRVDENARLKVSMFGFVPKEVAVGGRTSINVVLTEDSETLEEMVVVGYGVQKRANLTGAVASVDSEDLLKSKTANTSNNLIGQVPGVIAKQAKGEPGADDSKIYIRGISTFRGDTSPAYIIDGVERSQADFARINPNDIESLNVLKDAASAAIFGMRGANGVILVTTKRGSEAKPSITYSGSVSFQSPTKLPKFANSYDYARLYNTFMDKKIYTDEEIQKFRDGSDPENYPNTDWYGEMLTKNALMHQHNLAVSGGTSRVRYYVSGGYIYQGGLWDDINYRRFNLRSNIDADITSSTRLKVDVSGRYEKSLNAGSAEGVFGALVRSTPVLLCRYLDGTFAVPDATHTNIVAANQPGGSYAKGRTFAVDALVDLEQKLNFVTPGLSIKGVFMFGKNTYNNKNWNVSPYVYTRDSNGEYQLKPRSSASLSLYDNGTQTQEYQLQINYARSFGNHNVSAMAMALEHKSFYETSSMSRTSFDSEILDQMNAGNSKDQSLSAYDVSSARISYMGRVNYDYGQKYLVEFNIRHDGSENFAPGHRWGTFMSGSIGWIASYESFFEPLRNHINFLKLRASYGTLGNDNTGGIAYPYYSRYDIYGSGIASNYLPNNYGDYIFGDNLIKGLVPGAVANKLATWEKSTKANVALDAVLFNHLNLNLDFFWERRSNILVQRSAEVPGTFGGALPLENLGVVKNHGVDLMVNYSQRLGNVDLSLGGNFTYARNKIVEMAEAIGTSDQMRRTGRPINGYYGYKTDGLFQSQEEIDAYARQEVAGIGYKTQPGDIKYVDVNGDGVVNSDDMTYLGNGNVPEIIYGFNGSLRWNNFDFSFLFQGAGRVQVYLQGGVIQPYFNQGGLPQMWVTDSWTPENTGASLPRLNNSVHNNPSTDVSCVDTYLYDASYLRLKNIELGYSLPAKLLNRVGIKQLRVYVSAQNLFTVSGVPQIDPENTHQQGWTYPQMKAYNIGLSLQF